MAWLTRMVIYFSLLGALFIGTAQWLGQQIVLEPEALQIDLQPDPRSDFTRWYLSERRRALRVDLSKTGACIRRVIPRYGPANTYNQCPWVGHDDRGIFVMDAVTSWKCQILEPPG